MKKNQFYLPLNLQLFAESGDGEGGGGQEQGATTAGSGEGGSEKESKVTFTPEQQAEVDRILSERLGKERNKLERDYQSKIENAKTEAEKLAKMNAEQKAEYERQKQDESLANREKDITRRELRAAALETLAEKSLPKGLIEILPFDDADSTNAAIEAVSVAFSEAVEVAVNERLKGRTPGSGSSLPSKPGDFGKQLAEQYNKSNEKLEEAKKHYFN